MGEGRGTIRKVKFPNKLIHAMWNVHLIAYLIGLQFLNCYVKIGIIIIATQSLGKEGESCRLQMSTQP